MCFPFTCLQAKPQDTLDLCQLLNNDLAATVASHPKRFVGLGTLPMQAPELAVKEMERCVKELGFVGWHTHSNYGETAADHPRYRPLFHKAEELGIYVYLHPQLAHKSRVDDCGFPVAGPGLGFTLDTMTTLTRMIVGGLLDEVPNLKLVLGHYGEALPFLLDRMDNRLAFLPNPKAKNQHNFSYYFHKNIYVTTSGNMSNEAFECTRRVLGLDRILFGSDYAFENPKEMVEYVKNLPLGEKEREMLYCKNAEALGVKL